MFITLSPRSLITSSITEDLPAPGAPAKIMALGAPCTSLSNLTNEIIFTRLRINIRDFS